MLATAVIDANAVTQERAARAPPRRAHSAASASRAGPGGFRSRQHSREQPRARSSAATATRASAGGCGGPAGLGRIDLIGQEQRLAPRSAPRSSAGTQTAADELACSAPRPALAPSPSSLQQPRSRRPQQLPAPELSAPLPRPLLAGVALPPGRATYEDEAGRPQLEAAAGRQPPGHSGAEGMAAHRGEQLRALRDCELKFEASVRSGSAALQEASCFDLGCKKFGMGDAEGAFAALSHVLRIGLDAQLRSRSENMVAVMLLRAASGNHRPQLRTERLQHSLAYSECSVRSRSLDSQLVALTNVGLAREALGDAAAATEAHRAALRCGHILGSAQRKLMCAGNLERAATVSGAGDEELKGLLGLQLQLCDVLELPPSSVIRRRIEYALLTV